MSRYLWLVSFFSMAHSYINLKYHIVFGTKYRQPWITPDFEADLYAFVSGLIRNRRGRLIAVGGIEDHLHILAGLPQTVTLAAVVKIIKTNTSTFGKEKSGNPAFGWQEGYAAFSVSESQVPRVRRYIQRQKLHHRTMTYQDEVRTLCRQHGIQVEPAFFATGP
jgi:REP element-mobilizing transposase RayT